jgi:uncharacterized protein YndB with AHSA1/START domain
LDKEAIMNLQRIRILSILAMFAGGVLFAGFNERGNILIADQFNNRVIEVDRNHHIVWTFGTGSSVAGPDTVVAPNDAQRVGTLTLISGTGAPAGTEPTCPDGCNDSRVLLLDARGRIVWQYGQAGVTGDGFNQLNAPVCAVYLPNRHVLITDQGNQRIIEVNREHRIVWQYGMTGVAAAGPNQLNNPNSAELLENGHILIADESNNRVIEVTRRHRIVWTYGNPSDTTILNGPAFASRLNDGHTLIADASNNRILEVDKWGAVVFSYDTSTRPGGVAMPAPTRAVRLRNGNTLISDQFNHQVIEITPAKVIVFSQGVLGLAGGGPTMLNAPYDAKVIGDYTGLTPPFEDEDGRDGDD